MGRPDLLWSVNDLARNVTKWSVACGKRLHRLISCTECTTDWVQTCIVGDRPEQCKIAMFVDANFAGGQQDSKSTSSAFLFLCGPNTFVPITWLCKKQSAISTSSSESEVIALDTGLRLEGIPALNLWDQVVEVFSPKKPTLYEAEGNLSQRSKPPPATAPGSVFDAEYMFHRPCPTPAEPSSLS